MPRIPSGPNISIETSREFGGSGAIRAGMGGQILDLRRRAVRAPGKSGSPALGAGGYRSPRSKP